MASKTKIAATSSNSVSITNVLSKITNEHLSIKLGNKEKAIVKRAVSAEKKAASNDFVVRCSAKRV